MTVALAAWVAQSRSATYGLAEQPVVTSVVVRQPPEDKLTFFRESLIVFECPSDLFPKATSGIP